jgi:hypothetical protein
MNSETQKQILNTSYKKATIQVLISGLMVAITFFMLGLTSLLTAVAFILSCLVGFICGIQIFAWMLVADNHLEKGNDLLKFETKDEDK